MKRLRLLLAAVLVSPTLASGQSADERGALGAVERMFEGMRTADSAMVRSVFAEGARFASVDARTSAQTIRFEPVDGWLRGIAGSARRWDEQIYDVRVRVDGDIAHVWAPYTFYLDKRVRHCGVNAIDLLRDASGWKVTQLSDTRRQEGCRDPLAQKGEAMPKHASGTFEVKLNPLSPYDNAEGSNISRLSIDKQFRGDLDAVSKGEMLAAGTSVKTSAGYVAIERVTGTLHGRTGSFVLQHSGTMNRGAPQLTVTVVPDSGTGQLVGLAGTMTIKIDAGKHSYEFDYRIAPTPTPTP